MMRQDCSFSFFIQNQNEKSSCTVPFHSICQPHITGPQKLTKCHDGHGHFGEVTKSFLDCKKKIKN